MEGPFTESRKITFNGNIPKTYQIIPNPGEFGVYKGKSENNEPYELRFESLEFEKGGEVSIVLNRDGVELWKVKIAGEKGPESLQLFYNGTVYKADWKLEQSPGNEQKILLNLSDDHRFLEFVLNNYAQSGNFNLKSNFIVEVIEAVSRYLFEN